MSDLDGFVPTFEHHLDGLPAAIIPGDADDKGRVLVWIDGHTYRVDPDYLRPLSGAVQP